MQKIVVDTNVFMSALISQNGASFELVTRLFQKDEIINSISVPLAIEMKDVLLRVGNRGLYPQFDDLDLLGYLNDICAISHHVKINYLWRPFLRDFKDDKVLETAFNANANAIITHNIKDFKNIKENFGIEVITPKIALKEII
jgi:putative PIN family toxin of toxin-antitoxin system